MERSPVLTYDNFIREFRDKFTPEFYRDDKQREFLQLRQRNMTVAVLVATEKDKCRWFDEGLNYEIRSKLTLTDLRSYQDLRAAAIRAERLMKERERFLSSKKSKRGAESQGGGSKKKQTHTTSTQSQTRRNNKGYWGGHSQASGQNSDKTMGTAVLYVPQCSYCGRRHPGEYRIKTGARLGCEEQGHFVRERTV